MFKNFIFTPICLSSPNTLNLLITNHYSIEFLFYLCLWNSIYFNQVIPNLDSCQWKETDTHEHNQSYEFIIKFA